MGYYSDVAIGLKKEDFKALWEQEEEYDYTILENIFESKEEDDNVIFLIEGIKWYESYEEIKRIIAFLDSLERQGKPYTFYRIGEDPQDIESYEACDKEGNYIKGIEVIRHLRLY